jgi:transcriptional regulator with XRE-family HTH domain
MSELKQLLSRRVINLRQRAGMTQEELAQAAGVGLDAIGRLERGNVTPNVETLQRIAQVFQLDLSEFFRFEGTRAPNPVLDELDGLAGFLATKPLDDIRFFSQLVRDTAVYLDRIRRGM